MRPFHDVFSICTQPQIAANPVLLMVEVEYERESRVCNKILFKIHRLLYCPSRIFQKYALVFGICTQWK